jgi:hypothetical protein
MVPDKVERQQSGKAAYTESAWQGAILKKGGVVYEKCFENDNI